MTSTTALIGRSPARRSRSRSHSDDGAPAYDHAQAAALAELGVPALACTPDAFPDLLAAALEGRDVARWANEHGLHTVVAPS